MSQTSYDEMPYATLAQRSADPNRLAALGRLYGVEVSSPEKASVLEIGCGTGTNLLHIAERYPESRCVGIDISERHIREGERIAKECGIKNIELRCADAQRMDLSSSEFDFVLCHGVYSWVSPHIQQQILLGITSALRENGLAYISYNVLPGWRQRGVIRDIMLTGALHRSALSGSHEPSERLSGALELLGLVGQTRAHSVDLYGAYVQESVRRFKHSHPSYLFHEYLEDCNTPFLFSEFMQQAQLHGLQYVCEAKPSLMSTDDLDDDVRTYLSALGDDIITQEQCIDVFRNRMFRETVLCKDHHLLKRDLRASVFKSIHFVSDYRFAREAESSVDFRDAMDGRLVSTPNDEHTGVLRIIADVGYRGISFSDLSRRLQELQGASLDERALMHMIVRLWRAGFVDVALHSSPILRECNGIAKISQIAREQVARGEEGVVALQHRSCPLDQLERAVLRLSDGVRTFEEIKEALRDQARADEIAAAFQRLLELGFFAE